MKYQNKNLTWKILGRKITWTGYHQADEVEV